MKLPLGERLAQLEDEQLERIFRNMDAATRKDLDREFENWAQQAQNPPDGDWRVWLILAGRGFGKTRAGAEWVTSLARRPSDRRIALVAATMDEARSVMIEGLSGLLKCAPRNRPAPKWEPSRHLLTYATGVQVQIFSAENPDGLRGPEHQFAWCDELAKWNNAEETWSNLMLGLRQGPFQRALVTTTPRPVRLLKRLMADPDTVRTGGRSRDNIHLPKSFLRAVESAYAGTRLGRQELDGELIEDVEGALWTREGLEGCRVSSSPASQGRGTGEAGGGAERSDVSIPPLRSGPLHHAAHGPPPPAKLGEDVIRIVIGVDPPASSGGDACGIVVCGLGRDGTGYVLEDATVASTAPDRWAAAVASACDRWQADRIVAEANNGGDMVRSVLHTQDRALPVTLVHASRGKAARAEPVSLLYARGRVRHAGVFPELEDQLCGMTPTGYQGPGRSPDRADALVWALTELMLKRKACPSVRML
jgi:phage terminase large subunit-like protein